MTPFTMLDNAVIDRVPEIGLAATAVYLVLRRHCKCNGVVCWPAVPTIAREAGVTDRTVRRSLQRLVGAGLLQIEARRDRHGLKMANRYKVLPHIPQTQGDTNDSTTGQKPPARTGHKRPSGPDTNDRTDLTQTPGEQYLIEQNSLNKTSSCRKLRFDEADHATAAWMFGLIQAMNPGHKKPNLDQWANDVRLMREQDKRTDADIRATFTWANQDGFWRTNILSPAKLRKQFDQLTLKREEQTNGNRSSTSGDLGGDCRPRSGRPLPDRHYKPEAAATDNA